MGANAMIHAYSRAYRQMSITINDVRVERFKGRQQMRRTMSDYEKTV